MHSNISKFISGVFIIASSMIILVAASFAWDFVNLRISFSELLSFDVNQARHINNAFNRSLNQLIAVTFTMVAIAVPLTANMYSVKFLDIFVKDKINILVLALIVFANLNNTWVAFALKDQKMPLVQLQISFWLVLICFSILLPYLHYVFRFLHPDTLLRRLESEVRQSLAVAARKPARSASQRKVVAEAIEHISNIAIRSVERSDRATAVACILSLEDLARDYWMTGGELFDDWYQADQNLFSGFSSAALDELSTSKTWLEMKLFLQLRQIASAAVPKTHDVASAIARALRRLGAEKYVLAHPEIQELIMEYFNTIIRLAIVRKDARSCFTFFDHYRQFAESLNQHSPELALEIAYYFQYYGQVARDNSMPFISESVAHDLGLLVRHAWESGASNREKLLRRFAKYDAQAPLVGVKKAQALLASYFLLRGLLPQVELIRENFVGLNPEILRTISDDLMHVKRKKYWEVNERRFNFDYVPDDQREKLREFFQGLASQV